MTTEQEKYDRYCTEAAINQKAAYLVGLTAPEVAILKSLLGTWSGTGRDHTRETRTIHNIYQKLRRSLKPLDENSSDSNHQQQNRELKHKLQECRKKLNRLEDRIDELEVGDTLI